MCGRFAITLERCHFSRACAYLNKSDNLIVPKCSYIHDGFPTFAPSFNFAPTSTTPVLVSRKYAKEREGVEKCSEGDVGRVIWDMRWGLIPPWNASKNIYNAKAETILEKGIFKQPFTSGQRCVVAVNG